jgi:MYXO-CTERM domain-containing protein
MNTQTHVAKHPKITTQRPPLTGYLAGAISTAALLAAPQAEAAVTAVSFSFGPVYDNATDGNGNFSVSGGFGNFNVSGTSSYVHFGWPGVGGGGVYNDGSNSDPYNQGGLMTFFANGTTIGNGTNGPLGVAFPQNDSIPTLNFTSDQLNKNIGFQTSSGNYGYANVSWNHTAKAMTINSAFVESAAGTPITINVAAVPEPSRALLALAGLGGVALRRRRKQAA